MSEHRTGTTGEWALWWRWVIAAITGAGAGTAIGSALGLAVVSVVAFNRSISNSGIYVALCLALAVTGVIVGVIEEWVLRRYGDFIDSDDVAGWWLASSVGLSLGTALSLALYLGDMPWWRLQDLARSTGWITALIVPSIVLGMMQWLVIRQLAKTLYWWIAWNAAAGALISLIPSITEQFIPVAVSAVIVYSVVSGTGILWMRFAILQRTQDEQQPETFHRSPITTLTWIGAIGALLLVTVCCSLPVFGRARGIPSYPHTQALQVGQEQGYPDGEQRLTTFSTVDPPKSVLLFYRNRLANRGWRYFESEIDPQYGWKSLTFTANDCPFRTVTVTATLSTNKTTQVELLEQTHMCL